MRNRYLLISVLIIVATVVLSVGTYNRWWDLRLDIGPVYLDHLLGWIGFAFIGIYTPIYSYAKRRLPGKFKFLLNTHNVGNLVAFMLISMHFTQQIGRPAEFYPNLGTGVALYISVCLMVVTGFLMRFRLVKRLSKTWRFVHTSFVLPFYILILVHALQNTGVI
ncbi:MAG: hypothetical protein ACLFVA_01185 [Dehalococcoidia bacterium]